VRVDTIQAGDFLRLSAQRFPGRDCFVFDDGSSRSFAEVNRRVNELAGALHRRGVRKGDRVAILGTDSGEYVEVLLTLQMSVDYEIRGPAGSMAMRRGHPASAPAARGGMSRR